MVHVDISQDTLDLKKKKKKTEKLRRTHYLPKMCIHGTVFPKIVYQKLRAPVD